MLRQAGQLSVLHVENFEVALFSDTIIVMNLKLCKMVLLTELHLFILLLVTLTFLQGHSSVQTPGLILRPLPSNSARFG